MAKSIVNAQLLSDEQPSKAIIKLAIPATIALLAKAVYNIVDTAYIGLLGSDTSLAAVGVTLPILLIMVSVENIFAAGAAVIAGRQLGAGDPEGASRTTSSIIALSLGIGLLLCVGGIVLIEPLLRGFGASDAVLPEAKAYAFWMFIAALFNLPAQSMNCAARAESAVKPASIAVITGAALNVVLDPVFMFSWGLDLGVGGASLATTVSQCVTFLILAGFYASGRTLIKVRPKYLSLTGRMVKTVVSIGIPTAIIQICLALATSMTNIAATRLPDADLVIAAYGVVQRLVLIGCYVIMGFMQGYQPVAAYSFGARNEERFHSCCRFAIKGVLLLTVLVAALYIVFAKPLILLFNRTLAVAVDLPGGAVSRLRAVLYDDDHLPDHRRFASGTLPFDDQAGCLLHSFHLAASGKARCRGHLSFPAGRRPADLPGLRGLDPADETDGVPAHVRPASGRAIGKA